MSVLSVDYYSSKASALVCKSLQETGFAVLTQHPVGQTLISDVYQQWRDFFYSENKHQYTYQKPAQDGYFPFRTETAKGNAVSDLKEFYHFYPWGKKPPELAAATNEIYQALTALSAEILQWVEKHLPEHVANDLSMPLSDMIKDSSNTLLRILHYPPIAPALNGAVRAAAHEDINLITLLPAATHPGLEVLGHDGNWHAVNCDVGNIVINVGDMLQMCTRKFYRSTTHRVVNPINGKENVSRFSMPLFLHPHSSVKLAEDCTAEEYLHTRLREIGVY